jgi:protein SCO1/2
MKPDMPHLRRASMLLLLTALAAGPAWSRPALEEAEAVRIGQAAIGRRLGDHTLLDSGHQPVRLAEFGGKPLVVGLVYTSCSSTCPTIVQTLDAAVGAAQDALGAERFAVVTIGFDTRHDTPERMRAFARAQGIDRPNWRFLSGDPGTVAALAEEIGFAVYPSAQGFDHLALTTVVDQEGVIYRQIYGGVFDAPQLVEPLKDLVFGRRSGWTSVEGLINRVRLFCTLYDPRTGGYRFDYSPFVAMAIGLAALAGVAGFALREWRRSGRPQLRA